MTKIEFNDYVNYIIEKSHKTLIEKNAKYAPEDDALHNFHVGAQMDGSTTAQTIWHYMKKHLVALVDKIQNDSWEDEEDAEEKIQDMINYLVFMYCASKEYREKKNIDYSAYEHYDECEFCKFVNCGCLDEDTCLCTAEPCASCHNNFVFGTNEYKVHECNWEPSDD